MSDTTPPADAPALPEVLVFGMTGGFLGATINKLVNPDAASLGAQHQTQLVISPNEDGLKTRILGTLIQEFGLSQTDAETVVTSGLTPMEPLDQDMPEAPQDGNLYGRVNASWGQAMPMGGGNFTGPIGVPAPGISFPTMGGASAAFQFAWSTNRVFAYVNGVAQGPFAYIQDLPTVPVASTIPPTMDGTASPGVAAAWSAGDHVHPTDTSRYAASNPSGYVNAAGAAAAAPVQSVATRTGTIVLAHTDITDWTATLAPYALTVNVPVASTTTPTMDGTAAVGTGTTWARADHTHPSDTSRYAASNPSAYINITQARTGVTDGSNAAAGQIGEYLTAQLLSTAAVTITNGVDTVIITLPVPAGDFDVWGSVGYTMTNNNATTLKSWLNAGGTTAPSIDQIGGNSVMPIANNVTQAIVALPPMRVNGTASTTVALGASGVGTGTVTAWGKIMARRRR